MQRTFLFEKKKKCFRDKGCMDEAVNLLWSGRHIDIYIRWNKLIIPKARWCIMDSTTNTLNAKQWQSVGNWNLFPIMHNIDARHCLEPFPLEMYFKCENPWLVSKSIHLRFCYVRRSWVDKSSVWITLLIDTSGCLFELLIRMRSFCIIIMT